MGWNVTISDGHERIDLSHTTMTDHLFRDHIPGEKRGLQVLDGRSGAEVAVILQKAFREITRTRLNFRTNENDNDADRQFEERYSNDAGHGSMVTAILFLSEILAACAVMPEGRVSASC